MSFMFTPGLLKQLSYYAWFYRQLLLRPRYWLSLILISLSIPAMACKPVYTFEGTHEFAELVLNSDECVQINDKSTNTKFELVMQADGNLVYYKNHDGVSSVLWASNTPADQLPKSAIVANRSVFDNGGNLILLSDASKLIQPCPIFATSDSSFFISTESANTYGALFAVQTDGNLVIYLKDGHKPMWDSNSHKSKKINMRAVNNCKIAQYPGLIANLQVKLNLKGAPLNGQKVYYKVIDQVNKKVIQADTVVTNDQVLINLPSWIETNIGPDVPTHPPANYTLLVYGINYKGYSVANSFSILVGGDDQGTDISLNAKQSEPGKYYIDNQLTLAVKTYKLFNDDANPEISVSIGSFPLSIQDSQHCFIGSLTEWDGVSYATACHIAINQLTATINLPYQLNTYTTTKGGDNYKFNFHNDYTWK